MGRSAPPVREFWEYLWKREEEFYSSGKAEFRHNTSFVSVSAIAEQFYCEFKLENQFAMGEVPTEAKDAGTRVHDELIPQEPITKEEFTDLVGRKEASFAVLGLWGSVGGLKVVGMPDHIVWAEGRPRWLVELKTTKGNPSSLWPDQEAQVRIYGLLLDLMGFDCSRLGLALIRINAGELAEDQRKFWVERISSRLQVGETDELEKEFSGSMRVHLLRHERGAAVAMLMEKRGYWLGEREPTSSTSVGKCKACEYNSACQRSLFKPTDAPAPEGRRSSRAGLDH